MRRKLFLFTIITIFALTAADYTGMQLAGRFPEAMLGKNVFYEGKVTGIERRDEERISVRVRIESADGKKMRGSHCILLSCYDGTKKPWQLWHGQITFECEAELAAEARNPGCFSYRKHLLSEGITAVGYIDGDVSLKEADSLPDRLQRKLIELKYEFAASLSERTRGILMGMVFGDTSFLDEDVYEDFRNNGTAHVLAVSGLHVGIVYGMIRKVLGKRQSLISLSVSLLFLTLYCFLSSFSISALRAACMIMLSSWASYKDRRYDMLTAAGFTALIFIVLNPYVIFNTGFQMSFLAVCSIAFFYKRIPAKVPDGAAIMLCANIGLAPYQIYVFNWFSFSSFAANIPVVYLAGITVPLGIIHFLLFALMGNSLETLKVVSLMTDSMANMIIEMNEFLSFGGKGGWDMTSPPLWILIFVYLMMFFLASEQFEIMRLRKEKGKIAAVVGVFLIFALFIRSVSFLPIRDSDLIFVDVGQGDCVHIRTGTAEIMIDGGGKIDYNTGEKTLKPYLLKNGVHKIDLAIATHLHTDHFKGLQELEAEGMIGTLKTRMTAGKRFEAGDNVSIEALWPLSLDGDLSQDENKNCSVFMVSFKGFRILVTGDLDSEGEREMVKYYDGSGRLKADILKVGHHGSKTSTSDELLAAVMPEYAVIQAGKNNYGHPDSKIIEKCQEKGIIVLRNDTHGAVGFSFEKGKILHYEMINTDDRHVCQQ